MVLRGDVASRRAQIDARLVHAAIPELHLEGLRSRRERQQLIPEADAEDGRWRRARHHLPDVLDGHLALRGVAGAVAEEEAIKLIVGEVVVPWHHGELHPQDAHQVPNDVALDAAIDGQDVHRVSGRRLGAHREVRIGALLGPLHGRRHEHLFLLPGHQRWKVLHTGVVEFEAVRLLAALHLDLPQHGAMLADQLRHRACVHAIDARHLLLLQPRCQCLLRGVMRRNEGVILNDDGFQVDLRALEVMQQTELVLLLGCNTVVPH
mmetsp:Transcript_29981/g.86252  ORF Transcript_29981/g.86252 Transcript_29981/m.86252 type:complete len:264 (+) Transcript_29981:3781-4572(+)